jgi:zinc transport system substrate-binding protein
MTVTVAALAAACGSGGTGSRTADGKAKVVAAFYPVAEAARRVGGDRVAVQDLTPAGAEPHDLELTPDQVDAIQDAAVVFDMGRGFQPAVEHAAGRRSGPTVELLATPPLRRVASAASDPHVWLDPVLYRELVGEVRRALSRVDPRGREEYARNAAAFVAEIDAVHARYTAGLRDCRRRTIVTAHAAFGHLARRYGLRQEAIAGISPDAEPSAPRLAALADLVERTGVTTIFTEELVSPRVADALAREVGGLKTATLNPLEGLTPAEQARGDDWASVMRTNLTRLRAALGCA